MIDNFTSGLYKSIVSKLNQMQRCLTKKAGIKEKKKKEHEIKVPSGERVFHHSMKKYDCNLKEITVITLSFLVR